MSLSLVFLDDMIDDSFVIMNFSIIRAWEFFAGRWRDLSPNLVYLYLEHIMLFGHLFAKNLNLVKCLFQLCLEVGVSGLQAFKTVVVRVVSVN